MSNNPPSRRSGSGGKKPSDGRASSSGSSRKTSTRRNAQASSSEPEHEVNPVVPDAMPAPMPAQARPPVRVPVPRSRMPKMVISREAIMQVARVVFTLALIGFGVWWWFYGPRLPVLPDEAKVLVTPSEETGAILHKEEKETVFPTSVDYLSPRTLAPRVVVEKDIGEGTVAKPQLPPARPDDLTPRVPLRNWSGIVLVPEVAKVSKLYSSKITLSRVEAHPLKDGRLNVWVRMHNRLAEPVVVEKDCRFRAVGEHVHKRLGFEAVEIPARGYADVMFVSGDPAIEEYTILVRVASDASGDYPAEIIEVSGFVGSEA